MLSLLSTSAFAQAATQPAAAAPMAGGGLLNLAPLIVIFLIFYFLIIRPQTKKMREHQGMISALRRGDRVVTAGGVIGTVQRVVDDKEVVVRIAPDVDVSVVRSTITSVESKGEPLSKDAVPAAGKTTPKSPVKRKSSGSFNDNSAAQ